MKTTRWQAIGRVAYLLFVLLSGVALLPITGIAAEKLGWQNFAEAYQPDLDVITRDQGAPGSAFLLVGAGFPRDTPATVYVDGVARGTLRTSNRGRIVFVIQSEVGDPRDRFFITLATDAYTSATDMVRLRSAGSLIRPPSNWNGPLFFLSGGR